jgi:pyrroloquinoline-quinone synthase/pyrroloquinoline quinone biosynthesis protein D
LRQIGAERYHNLHRFERRLHGGHCTYGEVQAWALNLVSYRVSDP